MIKEMTLKEYVNCLPKNHQAKTDLRGIIKFLKWSINEIEESSKKDSFGTPSHDCEYKTNPESGYCSFHDKFYSAKELINEYENIK